MASQALHLSWFNPVHITFGAHCLQQVPVDHEVVVLADRSALSPSHESILRERLGPRCKGWSWIHSGLASIDQALQLSQTLWPVMQAHPEAVVLAIGGGSTLDLAKVLRFRLETQDIPQATHFWRTNTLPARSTRHALWAVPTTAGTGSEVTRWSTVWDTSAVPQTKLSWAPADGFANRAFVDPELTLSCPLRVTRDCALDTLSHALESLWNRNANAVTSALALQAAQGVIQTLPHLLKNPQEVAARASMARASLLAGLAMSQTQTALAHALSYELTLHEGIPHGEACALWLPMVWELALGQTHLCDSKLAQVFGGDATQGPHLMQHWLEDLGIQCRDLRADPGGVATLAKEMQSTRGRNFIAQHA